MNAVRRYTAYVIESYAAGFIRAVRVGSPESALLPAEAYQEVAELLNTSFDHNAIRMVLRKYIPADQTPPELNFIDTDNEYYTAFWCKDKETAAFVRWMLLHFQQLAVEGQAAKIEDFADAVHFLPLVAYQSRRAGLKGS